MVARQSFERYEVYHSKNFWQCEFSIDLRRVCYCLNVFARALDLSAKIVTINRMKKYLEIMRLDHWIKQFFIVPGIVCAIFLAKVNLDAATLKFFAENLLAGFIATCLIASANYVINEYLDAEFDRHHPTKKNRAAVKESMSGKIIFLQWLALTIAGLLIAALVNKYFLAMAAWLWLMGIAYNVKPLRTKDLAYLDVLTESINNMIRLLMGWFIVVENFVLPPSSIVLGYWMLGAFLMAIKRYAEFRMIDNPALAAAYRKSFQNYSEASLLISAFFYAMCSIFFIGVFLVKYRIELVLFVPALVGLYCHYFWLSFKKDSAVQKPEKLYHERGLMIYCLLSIILFTVLMTIDIPALKILTSSELIHL